MFKDIPMKIVVPIIVLTWILSLISALAIVYTVPSLIGVGKGAITSDKIADEAIITTKLADGNVTSAKILVGAITAVNLADGSIITVKIADGGVTTDKIADGNVTTSKIADRAIVTVNLADGAVTSAKILNGTILAQNLADGSIITATIADGAVTTNKIAGGNVTNIKLAPGAIPFMLASASHWPGGNTTSTSFVDMPDMAVNVTIQRPSTLVVTFSTEACVSEPLWFFVRALVNSTYGCTPDGYVSASLTTSWTIFGCNFYYYASAASYPATFTVKIQWYVNVGWAAVGSQTLAVMALPA